MESAPTIAQNRSKTNQDLIIMAYHEEIIPWESEAAESRGTYYHGITHTLTPASSVLSKFLTCCDNNEPSDSIPKLYKPFLSQKNIRFKSEGGWFVFQLSEPLRKLYGTSYIIGSHEFWSRENTTLATDHTSTNQTPQLFYFLKNRRTLDGHISEPLVRIVLLERKPNYENYENTKECPSLVGLE